MLQRSIPHWPGRRRSAGNLRPRSRPTPNARRGGAGGRRRRRRSRRSEAGPEELWYSGTSTWSVAPWSQCRRWHQQRLTGHRRSTATTSELPGRFPSPSSTTRYATSSAWRHGPRTTRSTHRFRRTSPASTSTEQRQRTATALHPTKLSLPWHESERWPSPTLSTSRYARYARHAATKLPVPSAATSHGCWCVGFGTTAAAAG